MSKVFIMGFVGAGNAGDEAILAGTLHVLRQKGVSDVTVFSWNPGETEQVHGVKALPVLPGLAGVRSFSKALSKGDLVLLGGGSLLQDGERRIVPFWLSRALAARLRGCTVVYHAQGVGPLRTTLGKSLVQALVPLTANLVTVRDKESLHLVRNARPLLVADPALALPPMPGVEKTPGLVIVALRKWSAGDNKEQELVTSLKRIASEKNLGLAFLPMHLPDDLEIANRFARECGGTTLTYGSLAELRALLAKAQLVIAMRLHAAILAAGVGTPVVGLSYDPKVQNFFANFEMSECLVPWGENFTGSAFEAVVGQTYQERNAREKHISTRLPVIAKKAQESVAVALECWRRYGG